MRKDHLSFPFEIKNSERAYIVDVLEINGFFTNTLLSEKPYSPRVSASIWGQSTNCSILAFRLLAPVCRRAWMASQASGEVASGCRGTIF